MIHIGQSLAKIVDLSDSLKQLHKVDLLSGDYLIVKTCHSSYTIRVLGEGWFEITGGWFDLNGKSPIKTRINGCTWGGSAIKLNIAAACGLCLEFGNRVVTSPIQKIFLLSSDSLN